MDRHPSAERVAHHDRRRLQLGENRCDRGRVVVRSPYLGRRRGCPETGQVQCHRAQGFPLLRRPRPRSPRPRRLGPEHGAPIIMAPSPPVEGQHPRRSLGAVRLAEEPATVEGLQHGRAVTGEVAGWGTNIGMGGRSAGARRPPAPLTISAGAGPESRSSRNAPTQGLDAHRTRVQTAASAAGGSRAGPPGSGRASGPRPMRSVRWTKVASGSSPGWVHRRCSIRARGRREASEGSGRRPRIRPRGVRGAKAPRLLGAILVLGWGDACRGAPGHHPSTAACGP